MRQRAKKKPKGPSTEEVYLGVIDNVTNRVRQHLMEQGSDDAVLDRMQVAWELRMMQQGHIRGPIMNPNSVQEDQNTPSGGTGDDDNLTVDTVFLLSPFDASTHELLNLFPVGPNENMSPEPSNLGDELPRFCKNGSTEEAERQENRAKHGLQDKLEHSSYTMSGKRKLYKYRQPFSSGGNSVREDISRKQSSGCSIHEKASVIPASVSLNENLVNDAPAETSSSQPALAQSKGTDTLGTTAVRDNPASIPRLDSYVGSPYDFRGNGAHYDGYATPEYDVLFSTFITTPEPQEKVADGPGQEAQEKTGVKSQVRDHKLE